MAESVVELLCVVNAKREIAENAAPTQDISVASTPPPTQSEIRPFHDWANGFFGATARQ